MNDINHLDDNTPPPAPDFLGEPSSKGRGIRRSNRRPIYIAGGLILAVLLALGYTLFDRADSASGVSKIPEELTSINDDIVVPVHPGDVDSLPPTPPKSPDDTVPDLEKSPANADTSPSGEAIIDPKLEEMLRLREKQLAELEAGAQADSNVQSFEDKNKNRAAEQGAETTNEMAMSAGATEATSNPASLAKRMTMEGGGGAGEEVPNEYAMTNGQKQKRAFLSQSPELETYLAHTKTPPVSEMEIKAGTVIPGVMISGINSDLPGRIIGQVRENVYDSATGQHLLIPAGTKLIGIYDSSVTQGQKRVLIAWQRIIFQNGSSISLDIMPGADTSGFAGFSDKVNNHYLKIFGSSLLVSAFSAGIQLSQHETNAGTEGALSSSQVLSQEVGRQMGQVGSELMRRNMNVQPTLTIRPGYHFVITVQKDIVLPRQ